MAVGLAKSLSGADTTNVPSNVLTLMRKRKSLVGSDTTRNANTTDDIKAVKSGAAPDPIGDKKRDSIAAANQPKYEKYIESIGYRSIKK